MTLVIQKDQPTRRLKSLLRDQLFCFSDDILNSKAKLLKDDLIWCGGAIVVQSNDRLGVSFPAEGSSRFDSEPRLNAIRQDRLAIGFILFFEQFPTREGDDACRNPFYK